MWREGVNFPIGELKRNFVACGMFQRNNPDAETHFTTSAAGSTDLPLGSIPNWGPLHQLADINAVVAEQELLHNQ